MYIMTIITTYIYIYIYIYILYNIYMFIYIMYIYNAIKKACWKITNWLPDYLALFTVYMVNEMVIRNGWLSKTDILFQKAILYSHHKENYLRNLQERIPPVGLRLKKPQRLYQLRRTFKGNGMKSFIRQK